MAIKRGEIYFVDLNPAKDGFIRIIDESGEDYLYHGSQFVLIELPIEVEQALVSV